jgi:hypothetical protein
MSTPTIVCTINFSYGPGFGTTMVIDVGKLGTNTLGDTATVIADVSNQVASIDFRRGRNATANQFQTGQLTLKIADQNGDFNPQNTSSPYYGLLSPMRKVYISADYGGTNYPLFAGYITSYTTTTPKFTGDIVYTTITAVDGFRLLQNAQITSVASAPAGQLSGARINALLDQVSWPSSMRTVATGSTTMQVDPGTARTSLAACQTIETSEYGAFYVGPNGNMVFKSRQQAVTSVSKTPIVYNDNGTGLPYFNAVWIFNDVLVFNSGSATRTGGTAQTATNSASITKYFTHSYTQTGLMMETDAVALDYIQAYIASNAETTSRVDAITLDLYTNNYDAGIIAALNFDYLDPVTITTTQPASVGTSTLTKTLQVFGVSHNITPTSWKTTLTTLEPIIDGFIIGSTLYGVLGTSVMTY